MIAILTPFTESTAVAGISRPMLRVGDHPVVAHDLRWLVEHGVRRVAIDVRSPESTGLREFVQDGSRFGLDDVFFFEAPHAGSAAAVRAACGLADEGPLVVLDSTRLFAFDLEALLRDHAESPAIATMAVYDRSIPGSFDVGAWRVEVDRTRRVLRLSPPAHAPELELVDAGCAILEPRLVEHVPPDAPFELDRDLFSLVVREGGVLSAHLIRGRTFGLDTPEAREAAVAAFDG